MDEDGTRTRQKASKVRCKQGKDATHDCAFLEPLAFPPDLPPVILMNLDLFGKG